MASPSKLKSQDLGNPAWSLKGLNLLKQSERLFWCTEIKSPAGAELLEISMKKKSF